MNTSGLQILPSVDAILADRRLDPLAAEPRPLLRAWVREALDGIRMEMRAGTWSPRDREEAAARACEAVIRRGSQGFDMRLRPVWNATGVLLHTNLGRAPLPIGAQHAILGAASGYSGLEVDLGTGRRASRLAAIRELIPLLTGAEAGFAVNNNAAALFLAVASLAAGREVLVSRGQLVEIGGSFRLPEILEAAGAKLREVGTTNRTRINDFEKARSSATALVLRVHRSNFKIVGFTEEPSLEELVAFCRSEGIPLVDDLGSGALRRYSDLFPDEPCVEDSIEGGADLIAVSGDKLLGVTQAGIIAGKREIVDRLARNPIARVVRLDKTLIAGLEAGLRIHLRGSDEARRAIPLLRLLSRSEDDVAAAAHRVASSLRARLGEEWSVETLRVRGEIGGGSLPGVTVESHAITLASTTIQAEEIAARLREGAPPVLGRIQDARAILDLRAIEPEDEEPFLDAVLGALTRER